MKFGTIGTGWITDAFIRGAHACSGLRLAAVYSRVMSRAEEFSRQYEGEICCYDDLAALANSKEIDAVYVGSPNALHFSQALLMLESGKHVICEKSATITPEQLAVLHKTAKDNKLIFMEAIMMLHQPQRSAIKAAMKEIGRISAARFDFSQLSSKYLDYMAGKNPNIFNPKFGGGCLMDMGVYCVYPALDFFGVPNESVTRMGVLPNGIDGFLSSIFVYDDMHAILTSSKTGQDKIGSEIIGDKGTIVIERIWQLTEATVVFSDGTERQLCGGVEKHLLMGAEAADFERYILHPKETAEEYEYALRLSVNVSEVMREMRRQGGIFFEEDRETVKNREKQ